MSKLGWQILTGFLVILAVVLLIVIYSTIFYFVGKSMDKKVEKIYQAFKNYDKERIEYAKDLFKDLDENKHYKYKEEFKELVEEVSELYDMDIVSKRSYVKQSLDITYLYLQKIYKELFKNDEENNNKLEEIVSKSLTNYELYNKKAMMFNSIKRMMFVKWFLKKYNKKDIL